MRWLKLLLILMLVCLELPRGTAQPARVTLNGRVVTGVNPQSLRGVGVPLPGVEITIAGMPHSARSDALGYFAFQDVPDGEYTLHCRKAGYPERILRVRVEYAGFPASCLITMNPANASLLGDYALGSGAVFVAYSKRRNTENLIDSSPYSLTVQKAMSAGVAPSVFWADRFPDLPMMPTGRNLAHLMNDITTLENCLMGYSPARPSISGFLELPAAPYWPCFSSDGSVLYLALEGGLLQVRDCLRANELIRNLPLPGHISSLSLSHDGRYLTIAHSGKPCGVTLLDTATHLPAGFVPTPRAPFAAVMASNRLFVCEGDARRGEVQAYDAASGTPLARALVGNCPTAMAFSPDLRKLYVACSGHARVDVLDTVDLALSGSIQVGLSPQQLAVSPDGSRCFVANKTDNTVSVIDTERGTVVATVKVGREPTGIAFAPDGRRGFVACRKDGCVMTLDGRNGTLLHTTIPMPHAVPTGVAVRP